MHKPNEHTLTVSIHSGLPGLDELFALDLALEKAILDAGVGAFDGHGYVDDLSEGDLVMYGPDADQLLAAVWPVLMATPFVRGADIHLRYGPDFRSARMKVGDLH